MSPESQRHLAIRGLDLSEYAEDSLSPLRRGGPRPDHRDVDQTGASQGCVGHRAGARQSLRPRTGRPSRRLAGDPRVSALAHALESKEVAQYLQNRISRQVHFGAHCRSSPVPRDP